MDNPIRILSYLFPVGARLVGTMILVHNAQRSSSPSNYVWYVGTKEEEQMDK